MWEILGIVSRIVVLLIATFSIIAGIVGMRRGAAAERQYKESLKAQRPTLELFSDELIRLLVSMEEKVPTTWEIEGVQFDSRSTSFMFGETRVARRIPTKKILI